MCRMCFHIHFVRVHRSPDVNLLLGILICSATILLPPLFPTLCLTWNLSDYAVLVNI